MDNSAKRLKALHEIEKLIRGVGERMTIVDHTGVRQANRDRGRWYGEVDTLLAPASCGS